MKPLPSADPGILAKPDEYSVTHDLVNNSTTLRLVRIRGAMDQRSSFTVFSDNPARAFVKANVIYTVDRVDSKIQVETSELTWSDETAFTHLVDVEITVNGKRHFNKSWSVTVPRALN